MDKEREKENRNREKRERIPDKIDDFYQNLINGETKYLILHKKKKLNNFFKKNTHRSN